MPTPTFNEWAAAIRFTSASKGFEAPNADNIHKKLLLVISEICEAQEELCDGRGLTEIYYPSAEEANGPHGPLDKPEGFPIELADAVIRLLDIMYSVGIDIDAVIEQKMAFNKTRPEKHGRQF